MVNKQDPQVQPLSNSQDSDLHEEKVSALKAIELRFWPHVKRASEFLMEMVVYGLIVFAIILADLRYLRYRGIKLNTMTIYDSAATFVAFVAPIYLNLRLKKHTHSYFETWSKRLLDDLSVQQQLKRTSMTEDKCIAETDDSRLTVAWFPWGKVCIHFLKELSIYLVVFCPLLFVAHMRKENFKPKSDARGLLEIFLFGLMFFSPMYLNVALFRSVDPYFEKKEEKVVDGTTFKGGDRPFYPCRKIARTFLKEISIYGFIILTLIFTCLKIAGYLGIQIHHAYSLLLFFAFGLVFCSPEYILLAFERQLHPYFEMWKKAFLDDIPKQQQVDQAHKSQDNDAPAPTVAPQHISLSTILVQHINAAITNVCWTILLLSCSCCVGYLFEANPAPRFMFVLFGVGILCFESKRRNFIVRQTVHVLFEKYKRQPRGSSDYA